MDGWQRVNGLDVLCVEPITGAEVVNAGLVLPHGYADETPSELGIGAAAVAIIVRELARPRETDAGVVQVQSAGRVNLRDTVVQLTGSRDAVRLGLITLGQILTDPRPLDLTGSAGPATPVSLARLDERTDGLVRDGRRGLRRRVRTDLVR